MNSVKFAFCRGNLPLAEKLQSILGKNILKISNFKDGEIGIQLLEPVKKKQVFLFQSLAPPVNDNLVELLLVLSTLRREGASHIEVFLPYLAYARGDKVVNNYRTLAGSDVLNLIRASGADFLHLWDIHSEQLLCSIFDKMGVRHHEGAAFAGQVVALEKMESPVVVSPDMGGVKRAKHVADFLKEKSGQNVDFAVFDKTRVKANEVDSVTLLKGTVEKRNCIIIDDMIDTGGTILEVANKLKTLGATKVVAYATHGLLSGKFFEMIDKSGIDRVYVSDSIPRTEEELKCAKLSIISLDASIKEAVEESSK